MRSEELECSKHPLQGHQPWQQTALFTHLPAEVNTILLGSCASWGFGVSPAGGSAALMLPS